MDICRSYSQYPYISRVHELVRASRIFHTSESLCMIFYTLLYHESQEIIYPNLRISLGTLWDIHCANKCLCAKLSSHHCGYSPDSYWNLSPKELSYFSLEKNLIFAIFFIQSVRFVSLMTHKKHYFNFIGVRDLHRCW